MRDYGDTGNEEARIGLRACELPWMRLLVLLPEYPRERPCPHGFVVREKELIPRLAEEAPVHFNRDNSSVTPLRHSIVK